MFPRPGFRKFMQAMLLIIIGLFGALGLYTAITEGNGAGLFHSGWLGMVEFGALTIFTFAMAVWLLRDAFRKDIPPP